MAERDPFGRLPDENPLAGLGWLSDGIESQTAATPVVAAAASDDEPDGRPNEAKRIRIAAKAASPEATLRDLLVSVQKLKSSTAASPAPVAVSNVGRIVKVVFFVAVLAVIALSFGTLSSVTETVKDGVSDLPAKVGVPESEPVGLDEESMLVRDNLAPALRRMRTTGLGRLRSLSIRPARIDAQLLTSDGRLRSVQQRFDGRLSELSVSGAGFAALPTIPFARADSAVPSRLARRAAKRAGRAVSQVDYVALVDTGPASVWTVVMKDGGQFVADARGRITRRIG